MNQKIYWDKVASEKNFTTPLKSKNFFSHVKKDSLILDYGCGYGRILNELYDRGFSNLIGVDFSSEMIKRAKLLNSKIAYKVVKSGEIPCEDNTLDAVLLLAVLTCVHEDEVQNKIMSEIRRVLKPSGLIYINDFILNEDKRNKERYEKYKDKYGKYGVFELEEGAVLRHFDGKRISEITNGFEEIELEKVEYTTMNGNKSNGIIYLGRLKE